MSAPRLLERLEGPNGVVVELVDETEPYGYANLLRAAVRLRAHVPGAGRPFEHRVERVGVGADEVDAVRGAFTERLRRNLLPYLFRPDFPDRFRRHHESRRPPRVVRFPGPP